MLISYVRDTFDRPCREAITQNEILDGFISFALSVATTAQWGT